MKAYKPYCPSINEYKRLQTNLITCGNLTIGSAAPIRVQSMTTTDTMDTKATVAQSIRMIEAGCELVRITAPSINEAKKLEVIKNEIRAAGYQTPLAADIHYTPNAAEYAARIVEKVRINPGNYADKKKSENFEYTNYEYEQELERIRAKFLPLVKICKEYGTAMRIGTNHGSLSDRILSRYGDTPLGMVQSALEYIKICEDENYHNIVLSMKASNTKVMVASYRLLVQQLIENNSLIYPLHLGVTEAGDGEDGRIKSAVGIGALLQDGLGDTVRVSLTEEPEFEMPVAIELVKQYNAWHNKKNQIQNTQQQETINLCYNPYEPERQKTAAILNIGNQQVPRVVGDLSHLSKIAASNLFSLGYQYSVPLDKWNIADVACDYVFVENNQVSFEIPGTLGLIYNYNTWKNIKTPIRQYPILNQSEFLLKDAQLSELFFVQLTSNSFSPEIISKLKKHSNAVLVLELDNETSILQMRSNINTLKQHNVIAPVIIKETIHQTSELEFQLSSSSTLGSLLLDGLIDGLWINQQSYLPINTVNKTAFGILQATRSRISKTEYISCPSCGRTLFDLQETTQKIRAVTDHLKGIKIGIMGCIVNGPGEMADADYGYVGVGVDKISLYKGKTVVKKNVPPSQAVNELINLIKENGDWVNRN